MVVLRGDLNFSLGALEIWGPMAHLDSLSNFLIMNLEEVGLLDILIASSPQPGQIAGLGRPK